MDHEHLLTIAEPLLHDLNKGPRVEVPKSMYTGGDFRQRADSEVTESFPLAQDWKTGSLVNGMTCTSL